MSTFTLFFPLPHHPDESVEAILEHVPGKMLRMYFHEASLAEYHLMGLRLRCKMLNQNFIPLRLTHVPKPGDTIFMTPTRRAQS